MLEIVVKAGIALLLGTAGLWLWRLADRWNNTGEVPKEWVESKEPRPWNRSDPGFQGLVVWQRAMAVLIWLFAGIFVLSILFQLITLLD